MNQLIMFNPSVLELEDVIREKRGRVSSNALSTAYISLLFSVRTLIEGTIDLCYKELGTKVLHVELKEMAEDFGLVNFN